ncbi:MAG TPA: ATP-binding protein [Cyclobacteriaceae bacterium]|nr:ATP-binding protein [Cyclobacteriaceae bacterium]
MTPWFPFIKTGIQFATSAKETRSIFLANNIAFFVFLSCLILFVSYAILYPWNIITSLIPLVGILSLITLFWNSIGKTQVSRLWICCLLPIAGLFVSIISKKNFDVVQDSEYYEFRFILSASSIIPCILFSLREKRLLTFALLVNFFALILFDPIHNLLGIGYYQTGQVDRSYYYTNFIIFMTSSTVIAGILFLKYEWEDSEEKNTKLINDLEEKHNEIESQNQEILAQSEILGENQNKLSEAYQIIEKQKELLSHQNRHLESELIDKNKELTQTNSELIKYNTELRQFSFTVSHNLRGPVASLLGLVDLIDYEHFDAATREVLSHIKSSAQQLDGIINDLSKIIDIRHDIFRVRQRVHIHHELYKIKHLFEDKLVSYGIEIREDMQCAEIFSVKPMVHSMLYNLISNSIKYRSTERKLIITVTSTEDENYYILKVADNGLGIDMHQHRDNLFKLYRRFHLHTEGKGLGLYLVKLQCESLGGFIEVDSELNKFTAFTLYLKKPANVHRQILYNENYALIFYDAQINSMGVIWRGPVTPQQYRDAFNKCLEFLKVYNTPNWIADLSDQGPIQGEDQQWMFREILPAAARNGLRRIAAIKSHANDAQILSYAESIRNGVAKLGLEQQFFSNLQQGINWIQHENEKTMNIILPVDGSNS